MKEIPKAHLARSKRSPHPSAGLKEKEIPEFIQSEKRPEKGMGSYPEFPDHRIRAERSGIHDLKTRKNGRSNPNPARMEDPGEQGRGEFQDFPALTVRKMGASNSSDGDSKTLKKKVCGKSGWG